jgi:hypothetical protein
MGSVWSFASRIFESKPTEPIKVTKERSCACGTDPSVPQVCVRAHEWYKMTSSSVLEEDYAKLKSTYETLASLQVDKDSEA